MQPLSRWLGLSLFVVFAASCDLRRFQASDSGAPESTGPAPVSTDRAPAAQPTRKRDSSGKRAGASTHGRSAGQGAAPTPWPRTSSPNTVDLEARRQARIDYTRDYQRNADQQRQERQREDRRREEQQRQMRQDEQRRQQMRDDQRRQEMRDALRRNG
jgi:hypothetical protein